MIDCPTSFGSCLASRSPPQGGQPGGLSFVCWCIVTHPPQGFPGDTRGQHLRMSGQDPLWIHTFRPLPLQPRPPNQRVTSPLLFSGGSFSLLPPEGQASSHLEKEVPRPTPGAEKTGQVLHPDCVGSSGDGVRGQAEGPQKLASSRTGYSTSAWQAVTPQDRRSWKTY